MRMNLKLIVIRRLSLMDGDPANQSMFLSSSTNTILQGEVCL